MVEVNVAIQHLTVVFRPDRWASVSGEASIFVVALRAAQDSTTVDAVDGVGRKIVRDLRVAVGASQRHGSFSLREVRTVLALLLFLALFVTLFSVLFFALFTAVSGCIAVRMKGLKSYRGGLKDLAQPGHDLRDVLDFRDRLRTIGRLFFHDQQCF